MATFYSMIPFSDRELAQKVITDGGWAGKVVAGSAADAVYMFYGAANEAPTDEKPLTLDEQLIALSDKERQRLYMLLYNSGCRVNR
ncbi:MAG: hypothetical protein KGJ90_03840 [Patescibacteria group bacterium]|nr:hypothetical protein [Patescibacteria group bacterium]